MAVGKILAGTPGDMDRLRRELKEGGGGDKWFWRVPADDEVKVRFMVEPYEFTRFKQHFINDGKNSRSFPCNDGDCEGCDEGNDPSWTWVAPVVDVTENRVRVLQVPKSVVESLMKKADRHGTVLNRDWLIIREGSGRDNTRYELDSDPPKRRDMSIYEDPDIMGMLEAQLEDAMGVDDDDDEPPRRGAIKKATKRAVSGKRRRESEEDEEPPRRSVKKTVKKTIKKAASARKGLRR